MFVFLILLAFFWHEDGWILLLLDIEKLIREKKSILYLTVSWLKRLEFHRHVSDQRRKKLKIRLLLASFFAKMADFWDKLFPKDRSSFYVNRAHNMGILLRNFNIFHITLKLAIFGWFFAKMAEFCSKLFAKASKFVPH